MITQLSGGSSPTSNLAQGTAAARPGTPATAFYYATDTGELSMANAGLTAWQAIGKITGNVTTTGNLTIGGSYGITGTTAFGTAGTNSWLFASGDFDVSTAGRGLRVAEGSNAKQGTISAMTAGSIAVANTSVTANSRIFVMRNAGGTNPGAWYVSAQTAGTGFTATSTNAADTGTGVFIIFEPG